MTLSESSQRIAAIEATDLESLTEASWERGRAIAEFAAHATLEDLLEARAAGETCMQNLRNARRDLLSEVRQARQLHDLLELGCGFCRTRVEPNQFLG